MNPLVEYDEGIIIRVCEGALLIFVGTSHVKKPGEGWRGELL